MKKSMKNIVIFTMFVFGMASSYVWAATPLKLSENGKTSYVIVLPVKASSLEQTAAKELKQPLDSVTGSDFKIVAETEIDNDKPQIVVGNSKRIKELLPEIDVAKIPYDGIVIKTTGKNLVLLGHPQRGTLYAVNTFLEDIVGVRWWTSTESFIPKKPTLEILEQNIQYAPKLTFRDAAYRDALDGVFATRMKCNGLLERITSEYGGHHRVLYFIHSFYWLIPPEKYFKNHPEWYSEIDGKRIYDHAQLCLTNEEMRLELTKNVKEVLRKEPNAKFFNISQMDWHGYCQCEKCQAVANEEGSQSGPLIRFINQVAEDVETEFPDVYITTLAYLYTRKPPKLVKPRKNVVIWLCTIECSFAQPLGMGSQNTSMRNDIQGWNNIAQSLFIWDYTVSFSALMLPHPNHNVLAPNIRFFVDNNTIGLFAQGDENCTAGDFVRLKSWVLSHLMWNPYQDDKKLFDEFIVGYYGEESAPFVKEYWKLLLERVKKTNVYLGCYQSVTSHWLDAETLIKAVTAMDHAVEAAKNETYKNRLRREKMSIDLALIQQYNTLRRKQLITDKTPTIPKNPTELLDSFEARCKEFGVTAYLEGDDGSQLKSKLEELRQKLVTADATSIPDFCKNLSANQWYEIQNFEINLNQGGNGKFLFVVDDAKASNGKAIKMHGWVHDLATYYFDESLTDLKSVKNNANPLYRIYLVVRSDRVAETDNVPEMMVTVWDENTGVITRKSINASEITGTDYHWITLDSTPLKPGPSIRFSIKPSDKNNAAYYLDRIIVVRE
ncbi:MAG: DUF4838 domain-containing protein [Planctomycetaceae bacterium]|jgi:hypothetical protein|nr:DUF4838 domain-containing protein [Planctomycetaceae bacterium]